MDVCIYIQSGGQSTMLRFDIGQESNQRFNHFRGFKGCSVFEHDCKHGRKRFIFQGFASQTGVRLQLFSQELLAPACCGIIHERQVGVQFHLE